MSSRRFAPTRLQPSFVNLHSPLAAQTLTILELNFDYTATLWSAAGSGWGWRK
jgi:hypothetical protein